MAIFPSRPPGGRARACALALAAALSATALPAGATTASDLFFQRTVLRAADQRCRLFQPEISAALAASSLQARGAALRSGADDHDLAALAGRAETRAAQVGCRTPELAQAADQVRKAFAGYARMTAMRFPGELSAWQADRDPVAPVVNHRAAEGPRWRLSQTGRWNGAGAGAVLFGLVGDNQAPAVVSETQGGALASGAFLTVRDPAKSDAPYLNPRLHDPAMRTPPASITRTFVAALRQTAPSSLLPGNAGMVFTFPPAVAQALEALDPREVVTVEFTYPGRPSEHAMFEVGDFAAGRAFLLAGR